MKTLLFRNLQNIIFALLLVLFTSWQAQSIVSATQHKSIAKHSSSHLIRLEQDCEGDTCG